MKETFVVFSRLNTLRSAGVSIKNIVLNIKNKIKDGVVTNASFDLQLQKLVLQSKETGKEQLLKPKVAIQNEEGLTRLTISPLVPTKAEDLAAAFGEMERYVQQLQNHPEASIEYMNVMSNEFSMDINQEIELVPITLLSLSPVIDEKPLVKEEDVEDKAEAETTNKDEEIEKTHTVEDEQSLLNIKVEEEVVSEKQAEEPQEEDGLFGTLFDFIDEKPISSNIEDTKEIPKEEITPLTNEIANESITENTSVSPISEEPVLEQNPVNEEAGSVDIQSEPIEEITIKDEESSETVSLQQEKDDEFKLLEDTFDAIVSEVVEEPVTTLSTAEESIEPSFEEQSQIEETQQVEKDTDSRLLVIDGNNIMFRSYFATAFKSEESELERDHNGKFINGVKVFIQKFGNYLKKHNPTHVVVCWDNSNPFLQNFRKTSYFPYKGLRDEKPKALEQQLDTIREVLGQMNVPQLVDEKGKYEADDLIGSVVKKWRENHIGPVFIVSGDKDLFQLLDEEIYQVIKKGNDKEESLYSTENFKEEYGISPSQWVDAKAVLGDTSDNIPGVSGVGEKTVFELLKRYGTLDGIYSNLTDLANDSKYKRYISKFEGQKEEAYLSKFLAQIVSNVEIPSFEHFVLTINQQEKINVFKRLGLTSRKGAA